MNQNELPTSPLRGRAIFAQDTCFDVKKIYMFENFAFILDRTQQHKSAKGDLKGRKGAVST